MLIKILIGLAVLVALLVVLVGIALSVAGRGKSVAATGLNSGRRPASRPFQSDLGCGKTRLWNS